MKKLTMFLASMFLCANMLQAAKPFRAIVTNMRGKAFVKLSENEPWKACYTSMVLDNNAVVKTNRWSKVEIMLSDRSKINVKGDSQIKLNNISDADREVEQQKGKSIFKITRLWKGNKFKCKTPVAVCSVRGTEFTVEVGENNQSSFKVFSGLVDVIGAGGLGEVSLSANEKIDVKDNVPMGAPSPFSLADQKEKSGIVRSAIAGEIGLEVSADLTKEAVQAAAADEMRLAEYKNGKTILDVFGNRVRIDSYIIRTAANQIKTVVLNERKDRYDYFTNIRTFNTALPADMSEANIYWYKWQNSNGTTNPTYYLLANESGASNTLDIVNWGYTGGHIVASNGTYKHLFDNYSFKINNITKIAYQPTSGSNITSMDNTVWTVAGVGSNLTRTQFVEWWGDNDNVATSYPSGSTKMHTKTNATFGDNSTYSEEYYTINDVGETISYSDFTNVYDFNQEMVLSGSDFKGTGNKIDLCVEPKIFIDAGLVSE